MTSDVNDRFAEQRRAQMAQFGSIRRDDGTWTGAGFDAYEVIGRDGLDTTLGTAALYTTTPAWHDLGNVVPGGTSDIGRVLALGGIDFDVVKRDVRFAFMGEDDTTPTLRTFDGQYVTVRTDTASPLGVVSGRYEVIQNRDLFTFLEDLVGEHGMIWESAGALRGGRKVFVSMRLPESVTIDAAGINDEIIPFVVMLNSHDASSPAQALVTPWRPVCANTERFAVRDAYTRWSVRHTAGALDRIHEARRALGLTVAYYESWAAEETALAQADITLDQMRKLIDDLWPVPDDATTRTRNSAAQRTALLMSRFETQAGRTGSTAYSAERTVTDYLDHVAPRRPGKTMTEEIARATALLEGTDDEIKTRAHQRLMLLTRR